MAVFTIHVPAELGDRVTAAERAVVVPEAFSWGAFLFGPVWFLCARAWLGLAVSIVLIAIVALVVLVLHPVRGAVLAIALSVALFFGFEGRQLLRVGLGLFGYRLADVVVSRNARDAEHAFFVRWLADAPVRKPVRPSQDQRRDDIIGLFPEAERTA